MTQQFCTVLSTTNDQQCSKSIINDLLTKKLAACVQVLPIQSHYIWQGNVCVDDEQLLIIKTQSHLFEQVQNSILQLHNYEVPQIVQLPIEAGYEAYLEWIETQTQLKKLEPENN